MITTATPLFLSVILSITASATTISSIDLAQDTRLTISSISTPTTTAALKLETSATPSAVQETTNAGVQELREGKRTGITVAVLIVFFALCVLFGYLFSRARRRRRNNLTHQDTESVNEGLVAMNQTISQNTRSPSTSSRSQKRSILKKIIEAILGTQRAPNTPINRHGQRAHGRNGNQQRGPVAERSIRQDNDPHQGIENGRARDNYSKDSVYQYPLSQQSSYAPSASTPSPYAPVLYSTGQQFSTGQQLPWGHDNLPPELREYAISPQEAARHKPPRQYAHSVQDKKPERLRFWERRNTRSLPDGKVFSSYDYPQAIRQGVHTLRHGLSPQKPSTNQKNARAPYNGGSLSRSQSVGGSHGRSVTGRSTSRGRRNDPQDNMGRDAPPPRDEIIWHEQPKDDGSMIRLLREVDGHLTDHILNYYIAAEGEEYSDETPKFSGGVCHNLDVSVYNWKHLPYQESRIFILRALIARKVIKEVTMAAQPTPSSSTPRRVGSDRIYRENMINRIARDACDEMAEFSLDPSNNDARLLSMEMVVRTAIDFAFTMQNQPVRFEFLWTFPITQESKSFNPKTMDDVYIAPRPIEEQHKSQKVRATVFPGLWKWQKGDDSPTIVAKAQVLLY